MTAMLLRRLRVVKSEPYKGTMAHGTEIFPGSIRVYYRHAGVN